MRGGNLLIGYTAEREGHLELIDVIGTLGLKGRGTNITIIEKESGMMTLTMRGENFLIGSRVQTKRWGLGIPNGILPECCLRQLSQMEEN